MKEKLKTPVVPPQAGKSHGQLFYEATATRGTAWEKLSKVSQAAYAEFAASYDKLTAK